MRLLKGLGKLAGGVAKTAVKSAIENYPKIEQKARENKERQERIIKQRMALRERMELKSTDELRKIVNSETSFLGVSESEQKMALDVLRSRGDA